ncbi:MAG: DUF1836 domain-containing protein [Lachnospiraceae bacterium]|nr:DUF1836 domain-containing protein [Lachnospiraceae bacterium]
MTIETEDLINSICASLERISYIRAEEIPNIDLYMDQVTTFMNERLMNTTRNPKEDKILTKTMINNYAKNDLLPPPVKKKYAKEHILVLIFIYYFKGILSIGDIQALLKPITDRFFSTGGEFDLETIYGQVCEMEKKQVDSLKHDVIEKYKTSMESFEDAPEENKEFLKLFAFICELSLDVYVKRLLIEKLIDQMVKTDPEHGAEHKKEKKESKKSVD